MRQVFAKMVNLSKDLILKVIEILGSIAIAVYDLIKLLFKKKEV